MTPSFKRADCSRCLLARDEDSFIPVPAEVHPTDVVGILTDVPGKREVEQGRPLVGNFGKILQDALDAIMVPRSRVRLINAVACRPYSDELKRIERAVGIHNRKHKGEPENQVLTPQAACRPRLEDELRGLKYIISMGDVAMNALRGGRHSVDDLRGTCETLPAPWARWEPVAGAAPEGWEYDTAAGGWIAPKVQVAYTVHPSRVQADSLWRTVFHHDIAKGFRYFRNKLRWTDPEILICKNYLDVELGFARLAAEARSGVDPIVAYDVETEGKWALYSRLRCISFANRTFSMVVPFLSIDRVTRPLATADFQAAARLVKRILTKPPFVLIGHNAGVYDRLCIEQHFKVTPKLAEDTILLDLLASNDGLPHRLGFLGSYHTDMPEAWKADNPAGEARTDQELWEYNAKDSCVTVHIRAPIMEKVRGRGQTHLIPREAALQDMAVGMQRIGMKINIGKVDGMISTAKTKMDEQFAIIREVAGKEFNPRSTQQMGNLLFKTWRLLPVEYSELTGEASTGDNTLRTMLIDYGLPVEQRIFVQACRMYRKHSRRIDSLLPLTCRLDQTYFSQGGEEREGAIGLDGRAHPSYNRLPASGRFSSSDPFNAQNIEEATRSCFEPEDGHVFVGCDADQLEARYIAEEAQAHRMCGIFNNGLDLHNETMELVYGPGVWKLNGSPGDGSILLQRLGKGLKNSPFFNTRGVTKNTRYAWQYAAEVESIWLQVTSAEDNDGKLIYTHITKDDIRNVRDGLNNADPEIPRWWKFISGFLKRYGYIEDTLWQRRRQFIGKTTLNEWVNHPIQAGGFHMVAEALLERLSGIQPWFATSAVVPVDVDPKLFQWDFKRKTGLVTQTHDSSLWEVPEWDADAVKQAIEASMTRRRKVGALLTYTGAGKKGMTWEEV